MSKLFESKNKIIDLIKSKSMTATQISERLGLGQSTVNQHVKELLDLGAIKEIDNPYSRKWKYYEYNKEFDKNLEERGYNMAKIRPYAVGIAVVALAAVLIWILYSGISQPIIPGQQNNVTPALSAGNFLVQLSDPPLVPPGTNSLIIYYSSIGVQFSNSSAFTYFNASGSADLLNLTNVTKTIAVLNIPNSSIAKIRLNVSTALIVIDNMTYNVTVPLGYIETGINSTYNSSTAGVLINMNPTIVRIYSQSNQSIFVMVPNVKAVFIGKAEVSSGAATVGSIERINPKIREKLRTNASIEIANATLVSNGNSTAINIGIKNTGSSEVNLTSLQIEGYMEEIMLGYQGYLMNATTISSGSAGISTSIGIGSSIGSAVSTDAKANSQDSAQSQIELNSAERFVQKFNNYLNFIVLQNGSLELPILDYAAACPETRSISAFIGCRRNVGMVLEPGSAASLHFSAPISIVRPSPEASASAEIATLPPVFGGTIKILLIPNQSYNIRAFGIAGNESTVYANTTATDAGSITTYLSKLVNVDHVSEQLMINNSSSNYTLQGFSATINGTANYTVFSPYLHSNYRLESVTILTSGFTLLGETNVTESIPVECPICNGEEAIILSIRMPGYQYSGPLSIVMKYSAAATGSVNNTTTETTTATTTISSTTNNSGYGVVAGKVSVGPLCPVERLNGTCSSVINTTSLYSSMKVELTSLDNTNNYAINLSSNGSFSQNVAAGLYSVSMLNCNYIGCRSISPSTITVQANETTNLDISIDTGIR